MIDPSSSRFEVPLLPKIEDGGWTDEETNENDVDVIVNDVNVARNDVTSAQSDGFRLKIVRKLTEEVL